MLIYFADYLFVKINSRFKAIINNECTLTTVNFIGAIATISTTVTATAVRNARAILACELVTVARGRGSLCGCRRLGCYRKGR